MMGAFNDAVTFWVAEFECVRASLVGDEYLGPSRSATATDRETTPSDFFLFPRHEVSLIVQRFSSRSFCNKMSTTIWKD